MKFFAAFLTLLTQLLTLWRENKVKQEGRNDAQEQLDANVAKAEIALDVDDPARLDRLRDRFDRSRG